MTRQVTRLLILLVMLLLACAPLPAQDKAARIEELMSLYNSYGQFNGSVLVAEHGKVIYKKGFGLANQEWEIPNQPDTKFRLASVTKQFTATLILQMVQERKLSLDGKLGDYLPYYPKKAGDRVTLRQLLNHTSGIPSYTDDPAFISTYSRDPYKPDDFIKKVIAGKELQFEPGSRFHYNNSAYFILGAIVERMAEQPYEKVLQERIFDQLAMKNSGYDHSATVLARRAAGYQRGPGGLVNAPYLDMSLPYSAGSLYSTVEDLYLWDQALYTDKLLGPELKAEMFKPGLQNYGFGFGIQKIPEGKPGAGVTVISHNGGINGFGTRIARLVDDHHLIVLLANANGTPVDRISDGITAILYDKPFERPKKFAMPLLQETMAKAGLSAALDQYRKLKEDKASEYDTNEPVLNQFGYSLLQQGKAKEAVEVFRLNTELYPKSFNVWDSLAEGLMESGDKEGAIRNYAKSLEMNPGNTGAIEKLKQLAEGK